MLYLSLIAILTFGEAEIKIEMLMLVAMCVLWGAGIVTVVDHSESLNAQ